MELQIKKRTYYFDTLRYLAAVWVFTTHFIAFVDSGLFSYLNKMPVSLIMGGISGKLCVAVFGVILGYFACQKGERDGRTLRYAVMRYLHFAIAGLVINLIYAAAAWFGILDTNIKGGQILISAILLRDDILEQFWCMRPFLAGSILCFIAGKYHMGFAETILLTLILILTGQTWIAITMFGVLLVRLMREEKIQALLDKKWMQALVVVIIFILINRKESDVTYLLDGLFAVGIILVTEHNRFLKRILENKWILKINRSYMGFYLINGLSYVTIGAYLINSFLGVPFKLRFAAAYLLCLAVNVLLALPVDWIVNYLSGHAERILGALGDTLHTR